MEEKPIVVVVPVRNAEKYVSNCMKSLKQQNYSNWRCVIVDDASTDNTYRVIEKNLDQRFTPYHNKDRKYALENIYNAITQDVFGGEDTIIALIDGDDWLFNKNTFTWINRFHRTFDFVYTQFVVTKPKNEIGWNTYPTLPLRHPTNYTHLRTFKKHLFDRIDISDFQDENGSFFKYCYDKAIVFPILEMCGIMRIGFVPQICYVLNRMNPNNVRKSEDSRKEQDRILNILMKEKKPYDCLYPNG